jgi:predicted RNA-binding protein associated with RNAse of E/G family
LNAVDSRPIVGNIVWEIVQNNRNWNVMAIDTKHFHICQYYDHQYLVWLAS